MSWLNIVKVYFPFAIYLNVLRPKNDLKMNEWDNWNSEGLSILSDDEDDETVNDASETATSWCHIYLVFDFILIVLCVISVPEINESRCSRAKEQSC